MTHGHSFWCEPFLWEIATFEKCKLNILNMHGCVVDQKLPYLYMCTNALMLAAKVCMHVAHVFQELKI